MQKWNVIGVMSGTSLDGLDLVYATLSHDKHWSYTIHRAKTFEYEANWHNKLKKSTKLNEKELKQFDIDFGALIGEKINAFLTTNHINAKDINLVSSHGHTVFHQPEKGITLQIGDGQTIANSTQIKTVNNFRTLDVKLGGQGAPLVPIGDKLLFSKFNYCLNIGGIANLTCKSENSIVAGDLTFANMASNYLAQKKNKAYDMDGELASNGCLNEALLYDLNQLTYFEKSFPKSLAFEDFSNWFLPVIENHNISINDKLNTLGHHLTQTIIKTMSLDSNLPLLITGGGAYNKFWVSLFKDYGIKLHKPDRLIIDYKEALIFALLGILKVNDQINVLSSVTGATKNSSSGTIYMPEI